MVYHETFSHSNHLTLEIDSQMGDKRAKRSNRILYEWDLMKKLQPGDEIVKINEQLGIAWILLPPDPNLEGFQGISPRIKDEEKFIGSKRKSEKE